VPVPADDRRAVPAGSRIVPPPAAAVGLTCSLRPTMSVLEDFKKFALKGNVVDLAVGVVIGGAFGKIVTALVNDVVMPVVTLVLPSGNWREHGLVLRQAANEKDNVVLKWGDLLGSVLDFLIVSIVLFILVSKILKAMEDRFGKKEVAPETTKKCKYCLEVIPLEATRCRACTSELEAGAAATAAAKT
jgi:large conductance mechanosensitive channel